MKYITLEQLEVRKHELIVEREDKLRVVTIGYDNAIAILDELIVLAIGQAPLEKRDSAPA